MANYGDGLRGVDPGAPAARIVENDEDADLLGVIGRALVDPAERKEWEDSGGKLIGWGSHDLDEDALLGAVGADGIRRLDELGWVKKEQVWTEGRGMHERFRLKPRGRTTMNLLRDGYREFKPPARYSGR